MGFEEPRKETWDQWVEKDWKRGALLCVLGPAIVLLFFMTARTILDYLSPYKRVQLEDGMRIRIEKRTGKGMLFAGHDNWEQFPLIPLSPEMVNEELLKKNGVTPRRRIRR